MKRVTIAELVRETGLSRATIDRALNGRGGVHQRTLQVIEDTARRLRAGAVDADGDPRKAERHADLVMRVGRGLMEQVKAALIALGHDGIAVHDMYQAGNMELYAKVVELCGDLERPLILTAKNVEPLRTELANARKRGKRIVTLVSDLSHDARDAFVGIDNRMAGQTAAFLIGTASKSRPATVGIILGDYAFTCHEDREIGFRSCLRANFPGVQIADVAKGEDSPEQTYRAVRDLLRAHPNIGALYNVAGGNVGLTTALSESGRAHEIYVVTHEANHVTTPLIREGLIHCAISQSPLDLMTAAVALGDSRSDSPSNEVMLVDFGVYTKFNLPSYAVWGLPSHPSRSTMRPIG